MADKKVNQQGANLDASLQESFFQKNLKKIGIAVAAIVVIILGILLYNNWSEKRNLKASEALYPCEQYFQSGNYEKALNGDGQNCVGLLQVANQYGRTKAGNLAHAYAGLAYAQLGKYEDAVKELGEFDSKKDEMISPALLGALGNSYAQIGQNDKAVETLKKAAEKADNVVLSPLFLQQAGEILESENKADEALELYEQIKDNYRASQQGAEIDKYIERIKAAKQ